MYVWTYDGFRLGTQQLQEGPLNPKVRLRVGVLAFRVTGSGLGLLDSGLI